MIHINLVRTNIKKIVRIKCHDCNKKSYFAAFHQEWYGWDLTCMRCGRQYSDGYMMPLLFYRYVRRDNKLAAHKRWKRKLDIPEHSLEA